MNYYDLQYNTLPLSMEMVAKLGYSLIKMRGLRHLSPNANIAIFWWPVTHVIPSPDTWSLAVYIVSAWVDRLWNRIWQPFLVAITSLPTKCKLLNLEPNFIHLQNKRVKFQSGFLNSYLCTDNSLCWLLVPLHFHLLLSV